MASVPLPQAAASARSAQPSLLDRQFLIVSGKGGVGRTTVAAALAFAACAAGRRVLLAQMDAPPRLTGLLGAPEPIGAEVVQIRPGLSAVNMTARSALHEYGLMVLRYEALYRTLFENRAVRGFLGAIPGLDSYAMLGKAWWHTTERDGGRARYDLVIVDAPASGHALTMLKIPGAILEAMPKGPLVRDAQAMKELLEDERRGGVVIVTLAEELPARETAQLARDIRTTLRMPLGPLIVNGVPMEALSDPALVEVLGALPPTTGDDRLDATLERLGVMATRRRDALAVIGRLGADPGLPVVTLPRLPTTDLGPAEVESLAAGLYSRLRSG